MALAVRVRRAATARLSITVALVSRFNRLVYRVGNHYITRIPGITCG